MHEERQNGGSTQPSSTMCQNLKTSWSSIEASIDALYDSEEYARPITTLQTIVKNVGVNTPVRHSRWNVFSIE